MTNNNNRPIILDTPEEINAYRFIMVRRAIAFRIKTGGSLLRNQELKVAQREGWTDHRTLKGALEDMNLIAAQMLNLPPI